MSLGEASQVQGGTWSLGLAASGQALCSGGLQAQGLARQFRASGAKSILLSTD